MNASPSTTTKTPSTRIRMSACSLSARPAADAPSSRTTNTAVKPATKSIEPRTNRGRDRARAWLSAPAIPATYAR